MQLNLNNFTTIKPKSSFGRQRSTVPLVGVTKNGFSFNSFLMWEENIVKDYVQIKLDVASGQLAFIFSNEKALNSYKVSIPKKGEMFSGLATLTAHTVLNYLNEETDLVNTTIYKYKFKPEIDEAQNAMVISLKDPYQKSKYKK